MIMEPAAAPSVIITVNQANHPIAKRSAVTVWYDGDCPLCRREIAFMRRLDKRGNIAFLNVANSSDDQCPINREALLARFHASENGQLYSGAAAFAAMWRAIPMLRPLGLLARNRIILTILEKFYIIFLKFRPKIQGIFK